MKKRPPYLKLAYSRPKELEVQERRSPWEGNASAPKHLEAVPPSPPAGFKAKSSWGKRLMVAGIFVSFTLFCRQPGEDKKPRGIGRRGSSEVSEIDKSSTDIREASGDIRKATQEIEESNREFIKYMERQSREFSKFMEEKNREIEESGKGLDAQLEALKAVNRRLERSVRGLSGESKKLNEGADGVLKKTENVQGQQRKILRRLRRMENQRGAEKGAQ
ncbi:hypothetical protein JW721_00300 [Candidatus Micrarchaeota archaeon]|nr:hypothetical protein [Candidatus Micrarchaeota archaeon]